MSVFIIAEASCNHNGNIETAFKLCDAAKESGADAVKFQTFIPEVMALNEDDLKNQKKYALTFDDFVKIKKHCNKISIEFMSTPFCAETARWLKKIGVKRFKISSGCAYNWSLLKKVASFGKETIISFGLSEWWEIEEINNFLTDNGLNSIDIISMYCVSQYPANEENINFFNMMALGKFGRYGFSDHTMSIILAADAVLCGAKYIEKHISLNRDQEGADHFMSLEPNEFFKMVNLIREKEKLLRMEIREYSSEEKKLRQIWDAKVKKQNE
jgi:N,N'-diacetyllegionaminate synthase